MHILGIVMCEGQAALTDEKGDLLDGALKTVASL